jgi:Swiss Army Knife RNA repair-like protein
MKRVMLFLMLALVNSVSFSLEIERIAVSDIQTFASGLNEICSEPLKTVVVFDCDGVLTNYPDPTDIGDGPLERGNITELLKICAKSPSVEVVVSSAWCNFEETLDKLKRLGLANALNITDKVQKHYYREDDIDFLARKCGNVISVKNIKNKFYRYKAFSPIFLNNRAKYDRVIFVDDNIGNINAFEQNVLVAPYAQNAQVFTFHIGAPIGEETIDVNVLQELAAKFDFTKIRLSMQCNSIHSSSCLGYMYFVNEVTGEHIVPTLETWNGRITISDHVFTPGKNAKISFVYKDPITQQCFKELIVSKKSAEGLIPSTHKGLSLTAVRFTVCDFLGRKECPIKISICGSKYDHVGVTSSKLASVVGIVFPDTPVYEHDYSIIELVRKKYPEFVAEEDIDQDFRYSERKVSEESIDGLFCGLSDHAITKMGEYLRLATALYHKSRESINFNMLFETFRNAGWVKLTDKKNVREFFGF